jgi:hypothetical protein
VFSQHKHYGRQVCSTLWEAEEFSSSFLSPRNVEGWQDSQFTRMMEIELRVQNQTNLPIEQKSAETKFGTYGFVICEASSMESVGSVSKYVQWKHLTPHLENNANILIVYHKK